MSHYSFYRVVALKFCGAKECHEDGLGNGPLLGPVLLGYFPGEHGLAHLLLAVVVVGAHVLVLQKGEEFLFVALQPLDEPSGVLVFIALVKELLQSVIHPSLPAVIVSRRHLLLTLRQTDGVLEQPGELLPERTPQHGGVGLVYFHQFGKQMIEAPLFCESGDLVVSSPKVTYENPLEQDAEHLSDDRRAAALGDEVVTELLGGKALESPF